MPQREVNVKFIKNDLNNIVLKDSEGNDLKGFIRHTEYYLTHFYNFVLKVDDEEFKKTKRVFVYLRAKKSFDKHLEELTSYVKEFFKDAVVVSSGEKTKTKFYTIDIFLYAI